MICFFNTWHGSSARKDSDYSAQSLPKYFVVNSSLKYELNKVVNVFVTIQNLTNKKYQLAYGYNSYATTIYDRGKRELLDINS